MTLAFKVTPTGRISIVRDQRASADHAVERGKRGDGNTALISGQNQQVEQLSPNWSVFFETARRRDDGSAALHEAAHLFQVLPQRDILEERPIPHTADGVESLAAQEVGLISEGRYCRLESTAPGE